MTITLTDEPQRERALNTIKSFIVQAPAGSGKTELLTRRFLKLLSCVNHPEEILAITFTKKSAAEMRDRIITALEKAHSSPEPESLHAKTTWKLAQKALKNAQEKSWNLLANPNRLRIQTIDSLNAGLARQLPTLSHFGAALQIADDPFFLYQEAVYEFLSHLEENVAWANTIEKLLWHMDNDLNKLASLLIKMLQKRDQWLPYITLNASDPLLRKKLEENLAAIVYDSLQNLQQQFPTSESNELLFLARFAAQNLIRAQIKSPICYCEHLEFIPGLNLHDKETWLGLAKLFLTEDLNWRKRIDKSIGFPSPSEASNPAEKEDLKNAKIRMATLIEKLSTYPKFYAALEELVNLPNPSYQDKQWDILSSLHEILQIVVAQLKVVFQQYGKVDYIENSHAALLALGNDENPTDLALALDYKIHHILVDEFQDTSNNQFRLLEKLIAGWQENDGRTLFLVGDPMQSIYRFREAEVGLFIRAREQGIKQIRLESLSLSVNFRSTPGIVNWINQHFKSVLPAYDNIVTGAISFSASSSSANNENNIDSTFLHPCINASDTEQANKVLSIIQQTQKDYPTDKIAILVRSRAHLDVIIPLLKKAKLAYQAIDIDSLISSPVIQDLMALTKALLHPANRIAWLAILRAPWCGLTLNDLLIISQHHREQTILDRLKNSTLINEISADGQERLTRITPILTHQTAERRRLGLRPWVETTWQLLGGPACTNQLSDLNDAATFFKLLEKIDEGSDLANLDYLDEAVAKLFASSHHQADALLQIMTIHNAKGLEFDTVILPYLEARTPHDEKQLLLWIEQAKLNQDSQLLLAPVHATGDDNDSIYDYIRRQQATKSEHEIGRLLYVAATRAKKLLHLCFSLQTKINSNDIQTPAYGLLQKLWPSIKNNITESITTTNHSQLLSPTKPKRLLNRLPNNWQNSYQEKTTNTALHHRAKGFLLIDNHPKYLGIVIHQILENICKYNTGWWTTQKEPTQLNYINKHLLQLGMLPHYIDTANIIVGRAIENTLNDKMGQWILHNHSEAKNEFKITALIDNIPQQFIIDRTFIDEQGTRWIIDYKSSSPSSSDLPTFLAAEQKKYESQMQVYHQALQALDSRPIRLGLYFPLVPTWHELP